MKTRTYTLIAAACLLMGNAAWAELPRGSLTFLQPTGTVRTTDAIDIWVRLTVDADSPAFTFSSYPLTGISLSDLPPYGAHYDPNTGSFSYGTFARIDSITLSSSMSGLVPGYDFNFSSSNNPELPGPNGLNQFSLAPGQSYDYLFGRFTPRNGAAPEGVINLFQASMTMYYSGVDAEGRWMTSNLRPVIASTCENGDFATCRFTRTVTAVPEPSSYALMALGLFGVLSVARRRRSA